MSFPSLASIDASYDYLITGKAEERRQQLEALIQHCHVKLKSLDQRLNPPASVLRIPENPSSSPIIPLFTRHPKSLAQHCQRSEFMIRPIVAPTVPDGQERIRICLHAANTVAQVDGLCHAIEKWLGHFRAGRDAERKGEIHIEAPLEKDLQENLSQGIKALL
jgi:8-amino-7-oxononanoate synthase